jgi:hypothetical protein
MVREHNHSLDSEYVAATCDLIALSDRRWIGGVQSKIAWTLSAPSALNEGFKKGARGGPLSEPSTEPKTSTRS